MGIRITKVTSKNTGMDRTKPAREMAHMARFSGKAETILSAITPAAPLSFSNWPRITPKPMGRPMPVIILPKPEEIVDTVSIRPRPPIPPMYRQASTIPMEALSFKTMMHTRMMAMATARCKISMAGVIINGSPFQIHTRAMPGGGPARAAGL